MKKLILLLCLLTAGEASAAIKVKRFHTNGTTCPLAVAAGSCKIQNAAVLDTSASWTVDTFGYDKLTVQVNHTFVAATAITMVCEGSLDGGTSFARITATSIAGGTGTISAYTDSYATGSASSNVILEYGVQGYDKVRCDLGDTAASTDTVSIIANVSVNE